MTAFSRDKFYSSVRPSLFGGKISPTQFSGTEVILDVWLESFCERTPITQCSVCLGTTFHETDRTMQPIREHGDTAYFTKMYDVQGKDPARARRYGNVRPGDGAKYCGRGDVQLTWYVNYLKATSRLHELRLIGDGIDFTKNPELVMQPKIAAQIMFIGMEEGWFTGRTLDQIVDPRIDGDEYADFVKSRSIINGSDRADLIAGYSMKFLAALKAASAG